jgi:2-amino-4-hydroxy-6-hydroxymethyldihydropteridine diphosphokinase
VQRVFLSLGSNLGDRQAALQTAVDKLSRPDFHITKISSIYETAPVDFLAQPDFLNIVVEADTELFPMKLLQRIQRVEREMGRKRLISKGPRTLDIDILFHGPFVVDTPELQIPHPRLRERRFVLEPLVEIAPDLRHPVTRQTVREMLAAAPNQFVRRTPLLLALPVRDAERRP